MGPCVGRRLLAALCGACVVLLAACAPRLDEAQVRSRLIDQMQLRGDDLRVGDISRDDQPVATIEYGGVEAQVRFRRQEGVWVIDAVGQGGHWESGQSALLTFTQRITEQARVRWVHDVMPRYAETVRLFVGWTELLGRGCDTALPVSEKALLDLHEAWHRTLFPTRGTAYHNADLFQRDAWRRKLRVLLTASRVEVQSSGADGTMDTPDDLRLVYERTSHGAIASCSPRFTIPAFAADALSNPDAPTEWNCADMLAGFKQAKVLEIVPAMSPR